MYIYIHTVCVYSIYTYMRMFLYMIYIYIYIHIKLDILICILIDGWIAIKCFTELKETGTGTCIQLCKWNDSHNLHTTSHHHKHKPQYVTFTTFSANLQALG